MDVVEIGTTAAHGVAVACDARAARADAIVVVGRVKPHTDFNGAIESGMLKMTAIGLGKETGAARYHAAFARWGYEPIIREVAAMMYAQLPVIAGLGIVEDNRGGTHAIEAFRHRRDRRRRGTSFEPCSRADAARCPSMCSIC